MGLSGFFSSTETSLFSLSSSQLEQLRREKHPRAALIQRLLSEPRRLIVTILIGNEFVNVAASVISAAMVIHLLGAADKWVNLLIMVPVLLLVGEITPKTLAIRNNIAFAKFESGPIELFARIIKPLRLLVRFIADWFITMLVGRERSRGNIITEDMVRVLAHEAVGEGALDHLEAQFIEQIFDFGNKTVEEVMTPRSNISFLPADTPLPGVVQELHRTRHSKVPVYHEHRDTIVGILHARDLIGLDLEQAAKQRKGLRTLVRKPYFVPESKPAAELFRTFRERKLSVALTVDEYGGVTGLVTMEDLLECIFGEIHSPSDGKHPVFVQELGEGRYAVDGAISVAQFNEEMGTELSEERAETVGGLLLHEHGELPARGAVIEFAGLRFTVRDMEENRIQEVVVERLVDGEPGMAESTKSGAAAAAEAGAVEEEPTPAPASSANGESGSGEGR